MLIIDIIDKVFGTRTSNLRLNSIYINEEGQRGGRRLSLSSPLLQYLYIYIDIYKKTYGGDAMWDSIMKNLFSPSKAQAISPCFTPVYSMIEDTCQGKQS